MARGAAAVRFVTLYRKEPIKSMNCTVNIAQDTYWVGASDRRLARFENLFPLTRGVAYNSYLILDEKTVLLDTADYAVGRRFFENLATLLNGRALDYVVVHHMEPDHAATLSQLLENHPETIVVCNAKTLAMIGQFFGMNLEGRTQLVAEGGELCTGAHTLRFMMAPMVHWPEVMVSYDTLTGALFSADAFGSFGALEGDLFTNKADFIQNWLPESRRYYANIVGKYGAPVQALLKKAAGLDIRLVCPLHGPLWKQDIDYLVGLYDTWSRYEPETRTVAVLYASMYGHTEAAAVRMAELLTEKGVSGVTVHDVSGEDTSWLIAEVWRCSHLVLASPTYNGGVYPAMENLLADMKALTAQNRTVGLIENGSWAPASGKAMRAALEGMKNMKVLEPVVTIKSAAAAAQEQALDELAGVLAADLAQG